jgi:formamidopyrimidine-DNA glycosylase
LSAEVINPGSVVGDFTKIVGAKVKKIRRFGKMLVLDFSNGFSVMVHLRMTGQLIFRDTSQKQTFAGGHPTQSFYGKLPDGSTRVVFAFEAGKLFFNDQRKFGFVKIVPTPEVEEENFVRKLAPEPFEHKNYKTILENLRRRERSTIKAALLDQHVVAGLGNIYADEALWLAKIHPLTKVGKLSDKKLLGLIKFAAEVMNESIALGGTSFSTFKHVDGGKGKYFDRARAYGQVGKKCQRCGTKMQKIVVAGRGTTFCPKCQKELE